MNRQEAVTEEFYRLFGEAPACLATAPGRVNLIGEHTDYNDGFVLPTAIDYGVLAAISPAPGGRFDVYSVNFEALVSFSLDDIEKDPANPWCDYVKGVIKMLLEAGIELSGAKMVLEGNVPRGAGLSSSAALEVASAFAFQAVNGFEMSGPDMARLCQAAESKFVGVNCGIMDQFISRLGVKDHALLIDCRTLDFKPVSLPASGVKIIVTNTMKKRGLVDSEYNDRRAQCQEAVSILRKHVPGITALRDVTPEDMERYGDALPPEARKRAEYVVAENNRVLQSVEALEKGDIETFGRLMNQSHEDARDRYEISCTELDTAVETAWTIRGVYGSRLTGAGFGGCTVSLVDESNVDVFVETMTSGYESKTGTTPQIYVCSPGSGARVL